MPDIRDLTRKIEALTEEADNLEPSRERSLIITKLDEARLWGEELIRRQNPHPLNRLMTISEKIDAQ